MGSVFSMVIVLGVVYRYRCRLRCCALSVSRVGICALCERCEEPGGKSESGRGRASASGRPPAARVSDKMACLRARGSGILHTAARSLTSTTVALRALVPFSSPFTSISTLLCPLATHAWS